MAADSTTGDSDDYAIALLLQQEFDDEYVSPVNASSHVTSTVGAASPGGRVTVPSSEGPLGVVDPRWEVVDPNPNVHELFIQFDNIFFNGSLNNRGVEVRWSPRMTLCAGLCVYEGRGGLCSVRLSTPLLKLRPRKDLVETLLHEMIHAFLFITENNRDHDGHGPQFQSHMHRINKMAGTHITIYHSFHNEVAVYRQHWWRCSGPCRNRPPFYGYVKRAMNRAPSPHDPWWADHQRDCGGRYVKVKEPDNYKPKGKGAPCNAVKGKGLFNSIKGKGPFNSVKGKGPQRSGSGSTMNHSKGQQKGQSKVVINGIVQKASDLGQATKADSDSKFPGHGIQLGSCRTQGRTKLAHSNTASITSGMDVSASAPAGMQGERMAPPLPNDHSKSPANMTTRPSLSPKAGTKRPPNRDIRDMFLQASATGKRAKVSSGSNTSVPTHEQATTAGSVPIKGAPVSTEHSHSSSRTVTHSGSPPGRHVAAGGAGSGVNVCAGTSADPLIDLTQSDECADEEVSCPVCKVQVPKGAINEHLDNCLQ